MLADFSSGCCSISLYVEQSLHTHLPHLRQWCRRVRLPNVCAHPAISQRVTTLSSVQSVLGGAWRRARAENKKEARTVDVRVDAWISLGLDEVWCHRTFTCGRRAEGWAWKGLREGW